MLYKHNLFIFCFESENFSKPSDPLNYSLCSKQIKANKLEGNTVG